MDKWRAGGIPLLSVFVRVLLSVSRSRVKSLKNFKKEGGQEPLYESAEKGGGHEPLSLCTRVATCMS